MKPSEAAPSPGSYIGHVRNGVVVVDDQVSLSEGQTVRVEPLNADNEHVDRERAERLRQLRQLFADWTEEDARLSDEEADRLHTSLEQSRGLTLRSPHID